MVYLFKKTAVVSVDIEPRRVPQGHRRLRFSFQINDFKDPNQQSQPNRLAPGRGGGGYLGKAGPHVNRAFQPFCRRKAETFRPQKTTGRKAERLASVFVSDDSIGARKLAKPPSGSKSLSVLFSCWGGESFVSAAPAAGPFPSEAAIYAAAISGATRFLAKSELSRRPGVSGTPVRPARQPAAI